MKGITECTAGTRSDIWAHPHMVREPAEPKFKHLMFCCTTYCKAAKELDIRQKYPNAVFKSDGTALFGDTLVRFVVGKQIDHELVKGFQGVEFDSWKTCGVVGYDGKTGFFLDSLVGRNRKWSMVTVLVDGRFVWEKNDDIGPFYQVTVTETPPQVDSGYRILSALLKLIDGRRT